MTQFKRRSLAVAGLAAASLMVAAGCSSSSHSSSVTTAPPASGGSATSSGPTTPTPTGTPYVIGDIGTYSGPYASSNIGGKDGVDAWVKYTNAHGGIAGHPVKVIFKDDQATGSLALTEVKQLVGSDHVIALVGNLGITEGAWDQYMSTQQIPVIGDDLASDAMGKYANFFPEGATQSTVYFYGVPKVASTMHDNKYGVMYCAEGAACLQIANAQKQQAGAAGVSYVFSTAASASATSYTAQCLAAKSSGATAVALLVSEQVAGEIASQCGQQGFDPQWLQASNGFTQSEAGTSSLDGSAGPVPDFPWFASDNPAEQDFQAAMRQYEPQDFKSSSADGYSEAAAQAWASAAIFGAAAKLLPASGTATGAELLADMSKLPANDTFGGLTPPLSYTAGHPQASVNCFFIVQVKGGKFTEPEGTKATCKS